MNFILTVNTIAQMVDEKILGYHDYGARSRSYVSTRRAELRSALAAVSLM